MTLTTTIRRVACAIVLLLTVAGSQSASAQSKKEGPTPNFFLLPTQSVRSSVTSIVPERIGELLREQVKEDARIELMPSYEAFQKSLGGSSAAMTEAEQLYTSGIGLLTAGEDKKAAETFQRALEIMESNLGEVTNYDVLADTLVNLSLAYHNAGFDLDGRKRMQQYADLRPDATLDPKKFPKELLEIFESEAKKVKSAGPGKLSVSVKGGDGLVFIDGVEKGKAPMTVTDVGFGYHYLVVRGTDGGVWSEQIRVRGRGKKQSFEGELESGGVAAGPAKAGELPAFYTDLLERIETGTFGEDLAPYLKELSSQTGAAYVGWVVMYKQSGNYIAAPFAYRASDGKIAQGDDVKFNIELSNLLVGVSTLSKSVVDLGLQLPADKLVTSVTLGGAATTTTAATTTGSTTTTASSGTTGNTAVTIEQTATPPDKSGNTWTYVGIAAGSIIAVGLVAGGIYLFSQGDEGPGGPGFNTEVTW